jgi:desumoylating isopeptidase 1
MPDAVLQSPLGRMILPQLNQSINASRQNGSILGIQGNSQNNTVTAPQQSFHQHESTVKVVSNLPDLSALLEAAESSCAVVFFTSATCAPCKMLYPLYDQLAAEVGKKASLIKVDIAQATDVGSRFSIRATPTFITFLKGQKENQWAGADPAKLRGNVQLLVEMAWPRHPHESLYLPSIANPNAKMVIFSKVPPMPKLMAKMGETAKNPVVHEMKTFLESRAHDGPAQATVPDMNRLGSFVRESLKSLPVELIFTIVDLLRCSLVDPRISAYFAEEKDHATVLSVLDFVNAQTECPYALRLVTLQMACNLFSTPLFAEEILRNQKLRTPVIKLISSSFLDESHSNVRVAASSLMYNLALASSRARKASLEGSSIEDDEIEIAASVLEAIGQEEKSPEALQGMLLALGLLVYCVPLDGQLADLLRVMDAQGTVSAKKEHFPKEKLVVEVGTELLGKGLRP